jgi:hypothetical protein
MEEDTMTADIRVALGFLKNLGTVAGLKARPEKAPALSINAHIHVPPNFSAFTDVRQAVRTASSQGIQVLGISNYYGYEVYADFADLAIKNRIFPLFGTEILAWMEEQARNRVRINDPDNPGKIYLCGKAITGFAPMNDAAQRAVQAIRDHDGARMAEMAGKLGVVFRERISCAAPTAEAIAERVAKRGGAGPDTVVLQERHVAQAFQECVTENIPEADLARKMPALLGLPEWTDGGDPLKIQNAIRTHLMKAGKPAYVPETFISFEKAVRLVLDLGGVPCYPVLADGARSICEFESTPEALAGELTGRGIAAAEFIPARNAPGTLSSYVKTLRAAGLIVTAGTEHNSPALTPIAPSCKGEAAVPADVAEIFREGACVLAAHQFLKLNGERGYVESDGRPHSNIADTEKRIAAFRTLGESVLAAFFRMTA